MPPKTLNRKLLKELYNRPGFLIRRCLQVDAGMFASACEELGITVRQYDALFILDSVDEFDQDRLALFLGLDRSTIGVILKILERKKYVVRRVKAEDKRKLVVTITPKGKDAFKTAKTAARKSAKNFLSVLDSNEQEQFLTSLRKLVENKQVDGGPPLDISVLSGSS